MWSEKPIGHRRHRGRGRADREKAPACLVAVGEELCLRHLRRRSRALAKAAGRSSLTIFDRYGAQRQLDGRKVPTEVCRGFLSAGLVPYERDGKVLEQEWAPIASGRQRRSATPNIETLGNLLIWAAKASKGTFSAVKPHASPIRAKIVWVEGRTHPPPVASSRAADASERNARDRRHDPA